MEKIPKLLLFVLLLAGSLFSCDNDNTVLHKNITGKAGEMVVVISKQSWEDSPGKLIRQTLAQPHVGLPQDEPLFDLIDVPHEAFKDIFKSTRNIIQTSISANTDNPGISFTDDVWAFPQATIQIKATNQQQFVEIFNENKEKILS